MDGSIADIRIDFVVETLELLLESNKAQYKSVKRNEGLSNYFQGKMEAYEIAIRTLKNAKEIYRDDYAEER